MPHDLLVQMAYCVKCGNVTLAMFTVFAVLGIVTTFTKETCKFFTTPLSRNSQERLEHKENQTKYRE